MTEYQKTVVRLLGQMRRAGELPFAWTCDNTRWQRRPTTYSGLEDALRRTARSYRRAVWEDQESYCEVWLEKDAMAGVLYPITSKYDVPLMVCKGYPSLTFIHSVATAIKAKGKRTHLYYFGDYDPSGVDISRFVEVRHYRRPGPERPRGGQGDRPGRGAV